MHPIDEQTQFHKWQNILSLWQKDGSNGFQFCNKNSLKPNQFYYWKDKILGAKAKSQPTKRRKVRQSKLVEPIFSELVDSTPELLKPTSLVQNRLEKSEICLNFINHGFSIELKENFCDKTFRRLLEVIGSC